LILFILVSVSVHGQELEPRSLTNVPVGTNFGVAGYGWTQGNILLDPAVSIEDLNAQMHAFFAAYVRAISIFGLSGKIDAILPFATGDWSGTYKTQYTTTSRTGFGDPRIRLSVNFLGARVLTTNEFRSYQQKTILGMSVQLYIPLGQYFPDRLINLGSNRFTIRPQIGISQKLDNWLLEAYASVWFFTVNRDFWGGNEMTQNLLYAIKIHIIRSLPKRMWVAADAGYGAGGKAYVNGDERESNISTIRAGGTLAIPIGIQHTFKISGFTTFRMDKGPDYDLLSLTYQLRWGGKQ
jgi:hypothetical protein